MNFLKVESKYYCGIDLHKERMYVCVMDQSRNILLHQNMRTKFDDFHSAVNDFLPDLIVGVESLFCYYWLFDKCREHNIPFYLGHAYYMKSVHGGKTKNDKLDSQEIANLLRSDHFPLAYAYPKEMRGTRDLLRRRQRLVNQRAEAYRHIQMVFTQQGIDGIVLKDVKDKENRRELVYRFKERDLQLMIKADLDLIDATSEIIGELEIQIKRQAKLHDHKAYNLLMSVDGIGELTALTILYEIHHIGRFESVQQFSSYCRLVRCQRESDTKRSKGGNPKIGNAYLKCAFTQIISHAQRTSPAIDKLYQRLCSKFDKKRARTIIAHKFAIAVYFMLKSGKVFDEHRFAQTSMKA
jgi:transposase